MKTNFLHLLFIQRTKHEMVTKNEMNRHRNLLQYAKKKTTKEASVRNLYIYIYIESICI